MPSPHISRTVKSLHEGGSETMKLMFRRWEFQALTPSSRWTIGWLIYVRANAYAEQ